jgi:hypothetical protein
MEDKARRVADGSGNSTPKADKRVFGSREFILKHRPIRPDMSHED